MRVSVDGQSFNVPDDATPDEIDAIAKSAAPRETPQLSVVPDQPDEPENLGVIPLPTVEGPRPDPERLAANYAAARQRPAGISNPTGPYDLGGPDMAAFAATHGDLEPKQATQALTVAKRTGFSPQFAADTLPATQARLDQQDTADKLARAPVLAAYAGQSAVHAAAVKDDLDNLSFLEWAITGRWELATTSGDPWTLQRGKVTPPFWWSALKAGLEEQKFAALATKKATIGATPAEETELGALRQAQGTTGDLGAHNFATKALVGTVKALPALAVLGGSVAAGEAAAGPPGAFAGAVIGAFAESFGPLYDRLTQLQKDDGTPLLSDQEARTISFLGAYGTSVAATLVGLPFLKKLPGVREVIGRVSSEALVNALARPGVARVLASFGKNYATAITMMMVQAAGTAATEEAAKATHGQPADLGRVTAAATSAAVQAAKDMPLLAAYHPIMETIGAVGRAHAEQAQLKRMADAAKQSKVVAREPGIAAEVIGQAASESGAASTAYVNKDAFDRHFGDQAVRRGGAAYVEADASGGGVAIPIEDHLTTGLADAEKLLPDTALSPGLTPNEAETVVENLGGEGHPIPGPVPEPRGVEAASFRDAALDLLNHKPIGQIRPDYYAEAGQKMGRRAVELAGEQDQTGLGDVQRRQAFNVVAEKAAREVQAEMVRLRDGLSRVDRDALARGDPAYLGAYDAMVGALQGQKAPGALDGVINVMGRDGARVRFDENAVRDLFTNPRLWNKLTPPEARNVADFVKNVQAAAARAKAIADGDRLAGLREVVSDVGRDVVGGGGGAGKGGAPTAGAGGGAGGQRPPGLPMSQRGMPDLTNLRKATGIPLSWLEQKRLDLNAWNGVLLRPKANVSFMGETAKRVLFDSAIDARNVRGKLIRDTGAFYDKSLKLSPELRALASTEVRIKEFWPSPRGVEPIDVVPRSYLWSLHLHNSSEGNQSRLLDGHGADGAKLDYMLYHNPETRLGRVELDFLQTLLDHNNEKIWPLLKAKEERLDGVAPTKIGAIPHTVTFEDGTSKTYVGGYMPLRRDTRIGVGPARDQTIPARFTRVEDFFGRDYQRAETFNPSVKERATDASYVVDLDWENLSAHITQVLHDIAFDGWVRDAARLAMDPEMQRYMVHALGPEKAEQVPAWIRAVAQQRTDSIAGNVAIVGRALGFLRRRMVTSLVGDSIPLAALQNSHIPFLLIKGEVGGVHGLPALFSVFKPFTLGDDAAGARWFPTWRDNYAESAELQHRDMRNTRRVIEDMNNLPRATNRPGRALEMWRSFNGMFMHATSRYLDTWVYEATKNEALAKGMSRDEAIRYASDKVQDLMPTHDIETASPLLTNRGVGNLLIMHGFQNTVYQLRQQGIRETQLALYRAETPREYAAAGLSSTWRLARWTAALAALGIGEAAGFHGPRQDQGEDWTEWLARRALAAQGMDLPWIGPILDPIASLIVSKAMTGVAKVRPISIRQAPTLALLQKGADLVGEFANGQTDDEKLFFDAAEMALVACNVPSSQTRTVAQYMYDYIQGNVQPRGPFDVVSGALGRRPSKHPESNLATASQDFISGN